MTVTRATANDGTPTPTPGFGREHLPYGALLLPGESTPHLSVRYGDFALDLAEAGRAGSFADVVDVAVLTAPTLNPLLAQPPHVWRAVRERVTALIDTDLGTQPLIALADARACLPFEVADYVDFYSCEQHARNLSAIFRPGAAGLPAAWKALPIGYHGRSGTVVVDGTLVRRPVGHQIVGAGAIVVAPSQDLDIELEIGFVTGGSAGTPLDLSGAEELIFGLVLVNDWSARDLQRFEYVPLGPFLGKSFATSVSAWVTPLAALEGARVRQPAQEPPPQGGLSGAPDWLLDLRLTVQLRPAGAAHYEAISQTNTRELYWTPMQQLVHAASNGASVRPGDLYASGTISGSEPGSQGSLIELSWNRTRPFTVAGSERTFLEDGDSVLLDAVTADGTVRLGSVEGTIIAAQEVRS